MQADQDASAQARYREGIQAALDRHESAAIEMVEISIMPGSNSVTISGQVMNLKLQSGEPIRIRFTLMDRNGTAIGDQVVTVTAPEANGTADFSADIPTRGELAGWKYDLAQ